MEKIVKVFWQTSWQIVGKGITSLSTLFILGFISRSFGTTGTGYLTLALLYLGFFSLLVDLGLNGYLLPKFSQENYENTWRKLFGLRLVLAAISIITAYLLILIWPGTNSVFRQLVMIGAALSILEQAVFSSVTTLFQVKLRYDLAISATTVGYVFILSSAFMVNYLHLGLPWFMGSYVLGWFFIMVASLVLVRKFIKNIVPIFDLRFITEIFRGAWPISATLVLNLIYFRLDSFLISIFRNFSEVGIYNLAYQIFQAALVLPTFIMNGYYPLMIKSLKEDKVKFVQELKQASLLMFLIGVVGSVVTLIFGDKVVFIITHGKTFADSTVILQILSLGFPLFFVSALLMWVLVTIKEYQALVKIYTLGLVVNGLLNLILIPNFSYWAAAWITIVSEGMILVLQLVFLKRRLLK